MADPRVFETHKEVEQSEALELMAGLLSDVPNAHTPYLERDGFSSPQLGDSSPSTMVEAARVDPMVRQALAADILSTASVRVLAHLAQRVAALENQNRAPQSAAQTTTTEPETKSGKGSKGGKKS